MEAFIPRDGSPEKRIEKKITEYLRLREWLVKKTHGNAYQSGWPDLFATHSRYNMRWIEVKLPGMKGSAFTDAQVEDFPKFTLNGTGIWVLTGDDDKEMDKLFKRPNWWIYQDIMKPTTRDRAKVIKERTVLDAGLKGPEYFIQNQIIAKLESEGWYVKVSVGGMYQSGFPDLYATHKDFRSRWIEVKLPKMVGSRFTPAQYETFPKLIAHGSGVWILTDPDETELIHQPPNLWEYWK